MFIRYSILVTGWGYIHYPVVIQTARITHERIFIHDTQFGIMQLIAIGNKNMLKSLKQSALLL